MNRNRLEQIWDNGGCGQCAHLRPETPETGRPTCAAFPAGIPFAVLSGGVDHIDPLPDDHGITFQPVPGAGPAPPPPPPPQCLLCKWMGETMSPPMCRAFHGPIPDEIFVNRFDHRKSYPGDDGMHFEPADDAEADELEHLYDYLDANAVNRRPAAPLPRPPAPRRSRGRRRRGEE